MQFWKWALASVSDSPDVAKTLYIAVAALRHSFDLLHGCLSSFLNNNFSFVDHDVADYQERYDFWTCLGVESAIAEEMAELRLLWRNGRVEISRKFIGDADLVERVAFIYMHNCRLKCFTDSRWATMGESSRPVVVLRALGLQRAHVHCRGGSARERPALAGCRRRPVASPR